MCGAADAGGLCSWPPQQTVGGDVSQGCTWMYCTCNHNQATEHVIIWAWSFQESVYEFAENATKCQPKLWIYGINAYVVNMTKYFHFTKGGTIIAASTSVNYHLHGQPCVCSNRRPSSAVQCCQHIGMVRPTQPSLSCSGFRSSCLSMGLPKAMRMPPADL